MPEMNPPRALVFRPLVKGNEALGTRLHKILPLLLRGEKPNYKSVAKEISKPPFLAPEIQWASKFTVFVRFTFPLNVSNHAHIWYKNSV